MVREAIMTAAAERIAQLRKLMAERGIDAYVIPMADTLLRFSQNVRAVASSS